MEKLKRRQFTAEFKIEAAKLVLALPPSRWIKAIVLRKRASNWACCRN